MRNYSLGTTLINVKILHVQLNKIGGLNFMITNSVPEVLTTNEIRAFLSFLKCEEISNDKALDVLKRDCFSARKVRGANYYATSEIEEVYNYLKERYALHFKRRNIKDFEDLYERAFDYCEKHRDNFCKPINRYI